LHALYTFDFLSTVSKQLKEMLEALPESELNAGTLLDLQQYQQKCGTQQGVYVIHHNGGPVYVGKANNVSDRLSQHLTKLSGRRGIEPHAIGYKALLLDKSMGTAANEDILITMFKAEHADMWNGAGFGPKDPGKERDTTKPGKFDKNHPIIDDFQVELAEAGLGTVALGTLLSAMKAQLPYVFRYDVPGELLTKTVALDTGNRTARHLLQTVVSTLGEGWKGAIISYGMVLYKTNKHYPYGEELLP
jgi:hypothetical protein